MCLRPVLIENVNYNAFSRNSKFGFLKDTTTRYIFRPCGTCSQCLEMKQVYHIQRSQCETFDNDLFYATLTYNKKYLPTLVNNGYKIKYADYHDVRLLMQRLRDNNTFAGPFKYVAVSEFGGERHRPHWHILFSVPKIPNETFAQKIAREQRYYLEVLDYWSENVGTRKNPIYERRLDLVRRYGRSTYDFHYVNPALSDLGELDVAFYISKYILKPNDYVKRLKSALYFNNSGENFTKLWNKVRPKILMSKFWGSPFSDSVVSHIRKGIDFAVSSKSPFPFFINPITGQTFPLCPYYKLHHLSVDDYLMFRSFQDNDYLTEYDSMVLTESKFTYDQNLDRDRKFEKKRKLIALRDSSTDYLNLNFEDYKSIDLLNDYGNYKESSFSDEDFANSWKDY